MSSATNIALQKLLNGGGFSLTKQRQAVLEAMLGQEPLTMTELTRRLDGKLDRVSIYRTINLFEKLGIVQRLNVGWKYKLELTDKFADHHHHLTCIKCGRVTTLNAHELETFIDKVAGDNGFKPTEHQIEIQGYCKKCR